MAVKRKKSDGGGGANWMDTYGDMVTLLMCFFVLLYSMSTISEDKFRALVQSFNPSSLEQTTMTSGNEGPLADPDEGIGSLWGLSEPEELAENQEDIDAMMAQLAEMLQAVVSESGQSAENVEISQGDGYIFISFNNAVFFRGDSYTLLPEGQEILNAIAQALNETAPAIDELRIMGHTAQARADTPNNVENDRFLASDRATIVTVYLQERVNISPARIVSVGYGQWRPIDSNETGETRAHNRRVELMITGLDLYSNLGDALQQYNSIRANSADLTTGGAEAAAESAG